MTKPLYQEDVVLWSAEQARALREAGVSHLNTPEPIDRENVAEEIESLGISQRTELKSRIGVILEHLMKLLASSAQDLRRGWAEKVLTQRAGARPRARSPSAANSRSLTLTSSRSPRTRHSATGFRLALDPPGAARHL